MFNFFDLKMIPTFLSRFKVEKVLIIGLSNELIIKNVFSFCEDNDCSLCTIDSKIDGINLIKKYSISNDYIEKKIKSFIDNSLNILPNLKSFDAIFINDDPNWFTIYNELNIIKKNNPNFPLVFICNNRYPYKRRDAYSNPENIPEEHKQECSNELSIEYDDDGVKKQIFIDDGFCHAIHVGTPKNGVLTAIENFLDENTSLSLLDFNPLEGISIIYKQSTIAYFRINKILEEKQDYTYDSDDFSDKFIENNLLLKHVSKINLLKEDIDNVELLRQELDKRKNQIEEYSNKINLYGTKVEYMKSHINNVETQVNLKESQIQNIESKLVNKERNLEKNEKLLKTTQNRLINIEKEFLVKMDNIEILEKQIHDKNDVIDEMKNQIQNTDIKFNDLNSQINNKNIQISQKNNQLKICYNQIDSLENQNTRLKDSLDDVKSRENKLKNNFKMEKKFLNNQIQNKDNQLKFKINEFNSTLSEKENKFRSELAEKESMFAEKENKFRSELAEKENLIKNKNNSLKLSGSQIIKKTKKLHSIEYSLSCYEKKLNNQEIELEYLKNNNKILKTLFIPLRYLQIIKKSKFNEILINLQLYKLLEDSEYFHIGYYLNKYPDVMNSKWCKYFSPQLHYICFGYDEGRKFNANQFKNKSKKDLLNLLKSNNIDES